MIASACKRPSPHPRWVPSRVPERAEPKDDRRVHAGNQKVGRNLAAREGFELGLSQGVYKVLRKALIGLGVTPPVACARWARANRGLSSGGPVW